MSYVTVTTCLLPGSCFRLEYVTHRFPLLSFGPETLGRNAAEMVTLGKTRWDAGFNREARKAILELTGKVDGLAPLDDLLARLFPHYDSLPNNER